METKQVYKLVSSYSLNFIVCGLTLGCLDHIL